MQDYKIKTPTEEISRQVQRKAAELGYVWDSTRGTEYLRSAQIYLHVDGSMTRMLYDDVEYFSRHRHPEISYQDFLRLGEPTIINNTTTEEIMSGEVTLKCITAPQKAKNITEGRDYTGILIDSDDTQVDSFREAKYFRCVNNNGIEAKYRLSLFASIEPPTPPAPPKITQQELIDSLIVDQEDVSAMYNGNRFTVVDFGLSCLDMSDINCSCGIKSCNGLDSLMDSIHQTDWEHISEIVSDFNEGNFEMNLFKSIVKDKIDNYNVAMVLFSTTENEEVVCNWMDSICDERNGWQTDVRRNPNSGNTIKAWLIPKI